MLTFRIESENTMSLFQIARSTILNNQKGCLNKAFFNKINNWLKIVTTSYGFRGLQTTKSKEALGRKADLDSVQGVLEFGLKKIFYSSKVIPLYTSSRTDTRVHADESTAHVDLEEKGELN